MLRFLRRLGRAVILALPPAAAGALLYARPDLPGLRMFAVLACGYSAAAFIGFVVRWRSAGEVGAMARTVAGLEHDLWKQRVALRTEIEVLHAERAIGLILREDVDFRAILERTLRVIAGLFGDACVVEVQLGGSLRALWAEGKAWFDRGMARRARLEGPGDFTLEAPLAYDGEEIGRVRVRARLAGDARDREERGRLLAERSGEIAGFLALAIKTPDLYTRAIEDGLTGLATKRHFLSQIQMLVEASRRDASPLSLVMLDIDHFKKVNDTHGHLAGDRVLKGVAEVLKKSIRVRSGDSATSGYRYGGEELSVLLPRVPLSKATQVAERLRAAIESKPIGGVAVTASLGVAQFDPSAMASPEDLIARADAALYQAKQTGRNRVVADGVLVRA
ncbi:MAG: GGDEF domain-containing protein [Planctomycetes bacterium]|nr:GGDEF domain-containing protein [Planctomycetota bacterium]